MARTCMAQVVTAPAGSQDPRCGPYRQAPRKRWVLVQPKSTTSMMVDSGTVSTPLNRLWLTNFAMNRFTRKLTPEIYV